MKPLASLCGGRPNLQFQRYDVQLGALEHVVEMIKDHARNNFKIKQKRVAANVVEMALTYKDEPVRDILQYLLCVIDKLAGGDGQRSHLLDGTARLYDEGHLHISRHPSWVKINRNTGYEYLALGRYENEDGIRMRLCVPLHHLICYLRWAGCGSEGTPIVRHDPGCPHKHCLSPGCVWWGVDSHKSEPSCLNLPMTCVCGGRKVQGGSILNAFRYPIC